MSFITNMGSHKRPRKLQAIPGKRRRPFTLSLSTWFIDVFTSLFETPKKVVLWTGEMTQWAKVPEDLSESPGPTRGKGENRRPRVVL